MSKTVANAQVAKTDWNARLVGRPLYLRGFWHSDQLRFDPSGKLITPSEPGPVTLSGVDVKSAKVKNGLLVLQANRVALVRRADREPGLERLPISSTTHIEFALRNKFIAPEEMKIVIEPDTSGDFEAALRKIFADGWEDLKASVPLYWKCYATSYFTNTIAPDAEEAVKQCVTTPKSGVGIEGTRNHAEGIQAPVLIASPPLPGHPGARGFRVRGDALIHLRVTAEGMPVGLQVVQAVGAGADEMALQTASAYRFQPAMLNGVAVPVDLNVNVSFH
ncbi:energy transducer TonB [Terriglobus saanensis]|uniref:energy transducer TonB n=1 Tax=Terriglobus saanensis TaxID=870903 RepID=UPI001651AC0A|nr:energy transducer TonB [Terriglobus saanensis]